MKTVDLSFRVEEVFDLDVAFITGRVRGKWDEEGDDVDEDEEGRGRSGWREVLLLLNIFWAWRQGWLREEE